MKTIRSVTVFFPVSLMIVAAVLVGCANVPGRIVDGRLTPPEGQAYVIVATTYQTSKSAGGNGESGVEIAAGDKRFSVISTPENRRIQGLGEMQSTRGGLHLLALPPGEYRLLRAFGSYQESGFEIGVGVAGGSGYSGAGVGVGTNTGGARQNFVVPLSYVFQVKAGEVVYIGDVHILLDKIPSASVRTDARRDFNHMKEVWKVSDFGNVEIRPAAAQN